MCNISLCNVSNILHFQVHVVTTTKMFSWDFMPEETFENKQVKFSVSSAFYTYLHEMSFFKKNKFLVDSYVSFDTPPSLLLDLTEM